MKLNLVTLRAFSIVSRKLPHHENIQFHCRIKRTRLRYTEIKLIGRSIDCLAIFVNDSVLHCD